ncbi:metallophosphoesterase 1 homolog [Teleopsis dalmanni]|uniref:metallophosphoesterase 1 homolog n=1 Tax=Teleopsis dalmanni TaxID=139649 RepID=UPI0018CE3BFA|nr:metallophosphoesterase 1 homolog [Teleopsis dalmanni]XP_037927777.1 metallophosphoesterase 1 homolog [Teleopsis dalmanni]
MKLHFFLLFNVCVILFCETYLDFIVQQKCEWPSVKDNKNVLHAMILADTHLLGPIRGHWLDKLYREWHMRRSFQSSISLFNPDIIFVLGDLFDEGDLVDMQEFDSYVQRFQKYFNISHNIPLITVAGNHDVGFHYRLNEFFINRFEKHFNNTGVELYTLKDVHFVLINSMAMENDGCRYCTTAQQKLNKISDQLECLKKPSTCTDVNTLQAHKKYSRPILMQHFPTYRISDAACKEYEVQKFERYRENWEVLSKNSTVLLGKLLQPRLAFAGHSHYFCRSINSLGIEEYTVASFNWRNNINPSFLLASFTTDDYKVAKCNMLKQNIIFSVFVVLMIIYVAVLLYKIKKFIQTYFKKKS